MELNETQHVYPSVRNRRENGRRENTHTQKSPGLSSVGAGDFKKWLPINEEVKLRCKFEYPEGSA